MSEVTQANASDGPPQTVEIPLDNTSKNSSRKSSTSSASTSSFENVNASKPDKANGKENGNGSGKESVGGAGSPVPATVEHEDLGPKTSPRSALAFKSTSLEDPTYYAPTTSSSTSPSIKASSRSERPKFRMTMPRFHTNMNRDPENVNDIVKIRFEEVFAEPEGTYSFGTIWGASHKIFTDTKLWCYKFLSAMCGVPCAFCWGIHFACLSFCQIWYCQPGIRSFTIQVKPMSRVYQICIKSFIEPCFDTIGRIFSSIRIHVSKD